MLGLDDRPDRIPGFLIKVIRVEDTSLLLVGEVSHCAPDVSRQDLLVDDSGPLLGRGGSLLGRKVRFHGS
jgi:hypothetical protein